MRLSRCPCIQIGIEHAPLSSDSIIKIDGTLAAIQTDIAETGVNVAKIKGKAKLNRNAIHNRNRAARNLLVGNANFPSAQQVLQIFLDGIRRLGVSKTFLDGCNVQVNVDIECSTKRKISMSARVVDLPLYASGKDNRNVLSVQPSFRNLFVLVFRSQKDR